MPVKAKYLNSIDVTKTVKVYEVVCVKCKKSFVTQRWGTGKINAVPCNYCDCMFNVDWEDANEGSGYDRGTT